MKTQNILPVVTTKKRASTTGTLVGTRFQATMLEAIDTWRRMQPDLPTRPEAVRRLVEVGMANNVRSSEPPLLASETFQIKTRP